MSGSSTHQDDEATRAAAFIDGGWLDMSQEIASDDPMFAYDPDAYFAAGRKAVRSIRLAMFASSLTSVGRVLDFGSGGGRVLRALKAAFPTAELTACNLHQHELDFCAATFGAETVKSHHEPEQIRLHGPFDLIWSGSVLTHIDGERWPRFLKLFESLLAPGGVAVFTMYGRSAVELLRAGQHQLHLTPEQADQLMSDFDEHGFGYQPTPWDGTAVASRAWVCGQLETTPALELVLYTEHAWLGQDVIGCVKC
jgi:SAM-dependent methyltransferase